MRIPNQTKPSRDRRGAVAVEFAVMAPVLLTIVMGLIEVSRVYEAQNNLQAAAREGARFAGLDRSNMLQPGQTGNGKIIDDIKMNLASMGIDKNKVQVSITDHENPGQAFDIDNPANELKLFDLTIEVPYSETSFTPVPDGSDFNLSATLTFRNGRATLSH